MPAENRPPYLSLSLFALLLTLCQISKGQSLDSSDYPVLWLKADSGALSGNAWKDVTGKGHDAIVFGQSSHQYPLLNYNFTASFNGADDSVRIPVNLDSLSEITVIAVFQPADTAESGVWGTAEALARNTMMTTRRVTGPDGRIDSVQSQQNLAILSTVVQNWRQSLSLSPSAYLMFASSGGGAPLPAFKGKLAELLIFDRALDVVTQIQYETYLAIKYGIPLQKGNYISADRRVIWDAGKNKDYMYRIAGIGRDSYFGLQQKQSISAVDADSLLVISTGSLAGTNTSNAGTLNNRDYLLWGDNNKALSLSATPDSLLMMLNRSWLMYVNGSTANNIGTEVRLRRSQLASVPSGYWMVVNPGGYAGFPVDSLTYIFPDQLSTDNIAIYRGLQWDKDQSGKDLFGFAQARDLLLKLKVLDSPTCSQPQAGKVLLQAIGGEAPFGYRIMDDSGRQVGSGTLTDSANTARVGNLPMGAYRIWLTDGSGHQSMRRLTMNVPVAENLPLDLGASQSLPQGGEIILDASRNITTSAVQSYQWSGTNGFNSMAPVIAVREPGVYAVKVTSTAGCVFNDQVTISGPSEQDIRVYPSPSTDGNFTVSVSLPQSGDVSVSVYDLAGNKQQEMAGKNNTEYRFPGHIDTPGMYMISVKTARGVESKKLLIL